MQKARKIAQLVRPSLEKPKDQKFTPQVMVVSTSKKRKRPNGREYKSPSHILCTPKELDILLDKWITYKVFKPNHVSREPTEDEQRC